MVFKACIRLAWHLQTLAQTCKTCIVIFHDEKQWILLTFWANGRQQRWQLQQRQQWWHQKWSIEACSYPCTALKSHFECCLYIFFSVSSNKYLVQYQIVNNFYPTDCLGFSPSGLVSLFLESKKRNPESVSINTKNFRVWNSMKKNSKLCKGICNYISKTLVGNIVTLSNLAILDFAIL